MKYVLFYESADERRSSSDWRDPSEPMGILRTASIEPRRILLGGVLTAGMTLATLLILAVQFATGTALAQSACSQGTTYDIRMCWSEQDVAADAQLRSAYAGTTAALRKAGIASARLASAQAAWVDARDKTCAFDYELYLPGSIAPQLGLECDVRMTRARARRLESLQTALQTNAALPAERPVSAAADAELDRVYRAYLTRLNGSQRSALAGAEVAWTAYRDEACALEAGPCLTELTQERVAELEASWIGEAFW